MAASPPCATPPLEPCRDRSRLVSPGVLCSARRTAFHPRGWIMLFSWRRHCCTPPLAPSPSRGKATPYSSTCGWCAPCFLLPCTLPNRARWSPAVAQVCLCACVCVPCVHGRMCLCVVMGRCACVPLGRYRCSLCGVDVCLMCARRCHVHGTPGCEDGWAPLVRLGLSSGPRSCACPKGTCRCIDSVGALERVISLYVCCCLV